MERSKGPAVRACVERENQFEVSGRPVPGHMRDVLGDLRTGDLRTGWREMGDAEDECGTSADDRASCI